MEPTLSAFKLSIPATGFLRQALTHKSFIPSENEENYGNNERIEFLGDAVLDLVISEMLMEKFPELDEGGLSKFRASLVSESGLSKQARELELGDCLCLAGVKKLPVDAKKHLYWQTPLKQSWPRSISTAAKNTEFQ